MKYVIWILIFWLSSCALVYGQTITLTANERFPCFVNGIATVQMNVSVTGGTPVSIVWESDGGAPSSAPGLLTDTAFIYLASTYSFTVAQPRVTVDFGGGNVISETLRIVFQPTYIDISLNGDFVIEDPCSFAAYVRFSGDFGPSNSGMLGDVDYQYSMTGPNGLIGTKTGTENLSFNGFSFTDFTILSGPLATGWYYLDLMLSKNAACPAMVRDSVFVEGLPSLVSITSLGGSCDPALTDVEVTVKGGLPPYQLIYPTLTGSNSFSTSDTVFILSDVKTGSEVFTLEDSRGFECTETDIFFIESPVPLSLDAMVTDVVCSDDSVGGIDITVSNAVGPVTFQWSTGEMTEDLSNLIAGTYKLTAIDSLGCTVVDSFVVDTAVNCPTSSNEFLQSLVNVFPNPSTGIFQIFQKNVQIRSIHVHNLLGQRMKENMQWSQGKIDLSDLDSGIYFLEIDTSEGIVQKKILKK
ncbi:MAG: T9SS type A sorting domain-containing protein [Bacteroidota bacterium]